VDVNQSDQVFVAFDVYRDLSLLGCMYYNVMFRTRDMGGPWSAWADPSGVVYFGTEHEWVRQTVALPGAAGKDSVQVRIGVKDYSPIFCDGVPSAAKRPSTSTTSRSASSASRVRAYPPRIRDLFHDTFQTAPFFADDNLNTARGDSLSARVAASRGLKAASPTTA
jgi:hypothetical protein